MIIRLDDISDEPFIWRESPSIPLEDLGRAELLGVEAISWSGRVTRLPVGYRIEADLGYRQELSCNRCLAPLTETVNESIDLMAQVGGPEPVPGEHELRISELRTLLLDGPELDTTPILLEQLQLNIPMKPLCRENCAGLCARCGVDRNLETCSCAQSEVDPRWAGLARLKNG